MAEGPDAFVLSLLRKACAQIIYAQAERHSTKATLRHGGRAGSKPRPVSASSIHITEGAADAYTDIAVAFIEKIGRLTAGRTQFGRRPSSNLLDVMGALENVSHVTNSNPNDLARYAMYQEIPFPHEIPLFPVLPPTRKRPRELFISAPTDEGSDPTKARKDLPNVEPWMPPLPSAHTYIATPAFVAPDPSKRDPAVINQQRVRVEKSLAKLKEAAGKKDELQAAAANAAPSNPFLALPRVGNGHVLDEDNHAAEPRTILEPAKLLPDDAADSNQPPSLEVGDRAAQEQKRIQVERILAESGGGTTAIGGNVNG